MGQLPVAESMYRLVGSALLRAARATAPRPVLEASRLWSAGTTSGAKAALSFSVAGATTLAWAATAHSKEARAGLGPPPPPQGAEDRGSSVTSGLARSAIFYWYALPIYTQYKLAEWWFSDTPFKDSEYYWDLLHDR